MSLKAEDRIVIDEGEKLTPLWAKLMKYWQARLDKLHLHLERNLDAEETAKTRGQIAELRAYMSLNKPPPQPNE